MWIYTVQCSTTCLNGHCCSYTIKVLSTGLSLSECLDTIIAKSESCNDHFLSLNYHVKQGGKQGESLGMCMWLCACMYVASLCACALLVKLQ